MKILAFDVSITGCQVGVLDDTNAYFAISFAETDRGQAEILIPMINEAIIKAGWSMQEINRIAVTQGPGSFTGVRIGLATARSLGLALNIPVFGLSSLSLLQRKAPAGALVLIDTKRGDYYGCVGDKLPRIWSEEDVAAFMGAVIKDAKPDLRYLAEAAAGAEIEEGYSHILAPAPIYMREAEVSQPKKLSVFAE